LISPCVKLCAIDPATRLCSGCGRTLNEIGRWSTLSDSERAEIMRELPGRRGATKPEPQPG